MYRELDKKTAIAAIALVSAVFLATLACSSGSSTAHGTVNLYLTDAPLDLDTVEAVNVTLTEVVLVAGEDDEEEHVVRMLGGPDGDPVWNLLDYRDGKEVLIGTVDLPVGEYRKVRLRVASAELVRDDDGDPATPSIVEPIFNPSGKVDVNVPFVLSETESLDITLDFDAALSIQVNTTNGQHPYILRPVIHPVRVESR